MRRLLQSGLWILASGLVLAACSHGAGDSKPVADPARALPDTKLSAEQIDLTVDRRVLLPVGALDYFAESVDESCAVCVRELLAKAFEEIDNYYSPGTIVRSDSTTKFIRAAGGDNELMLTSHTGDRPRLTFRFHTSENHLIGIAESDLTDFRLSAIVSIAPENAEFSGAIEIVRFAYGDGPAYLYSSTSHHLQVHCRILELDQE